MSGDPRFQHIPGDALTPLERQVAELWDANASFAEICAATGKDMQTVRRVVKTIDNRREDGADAVRAASAALASRIRQFHPHIAINPK